MKQYISSPFSFFPNDNYLTFDQYLNSGLLKTINLTGKHISAGDLSARCYRLTEFFELTRWGLFSYRYLTNSTFELLGIKIAEMHFNN